MFLFKKEQGEKIMVETEKAIHWGSREIYWKPMAAGKKRVIGETDTEGQERHFCSWEFQDAKASPEASAGNAKVGHAQGLCLLLHPVPLGGGPFARWLVALRSICPVLLFLSFSLLGLYVLLCCHYAGCLDIQRNAVMFCHIHAEATYGGWLYLNQDIKCVKISCRSLFRL